MSTTEAQLQTNNTDKLYRNYSILINAKENISEVSSCNKHIGSGLLNFLFLCAYHTRIYF